MCRQSFPTNDHQVYTRPQKQRNAEVKSHHHKKVVVRHSPYKDFSSLVPSNMDSGAERNYNSFPSRLFEMLRIVEAQGLDDIIAWQPHGRCFLVKKPKEFLASVLVDHFRLSKISSFQRQLNLYGFERLTKGPDRGGYYHRFFLRGREHLLGHINRVRVKGTGVRSKSNPLCEPNFYLMPWVVCDDRPTEQTETRYLVQSGDEANKIAEHTNNMPEQNEAATSMSIQGATTETESTSDTVKGGGSVTFTKLNAWGRSFYDTAATTCGSCDLIDLSL